MSNCPICGDPPYQSPFRLCAGCFAFVTGTGTAPMPEGHNRQHDTDQNDSTQRSLPTPCPRLALYLPGPNTNDPSGLYARSGAPTVRPATAKPAPRHNQPDFDFDFDFVAVPVTPPLSPMGGTLPPLSLILRTVLGAL